ncbi:NAD-dependent epimerase/dehydratase family protein [Algihabitans albus]|uniref:NAD-dependent epimerase/dehydratase family protein n=1 Tax=Algihabitans albus TaxID=2164067 RepID=UPI000E5C6D52|nr:NAD-dependent epimerase/dehydratase family protein [Algihabitans albus]
MSDSSPPLLVTGATGFIGQHVMANAGARAVALSLRAGDPVSDRLDRALAGRPGAAVIHLAGRAHASDPVAPETYRHDNRDLPLALAKAALARGVNRFVFVSTIAVHGASSGAGAFHAGDRPNPQSAYARAKLEAEEALTGLVDQGLELVIVRPPLVYGAGAKANLARLADAVARGLPLPLGAVRNRRSLVNAKDLADLLLLAASHPQAPGGIFLPADRTPVSTAELIRALGEALGKPARLLPIPVALLRLAGRLTRQTRTIGQLVDSLEVAPSPAIERLAWVPRRGLAEGLAAFAAARRGTVRTE